MLPQTQTQLIVRGTLFTSQIEPKIQYDHYQSSAKSIIVSKIGISGKEALVDWEPIRYYNKSLSCKAKELPSTCKTCSGFLYRGFFHIKGFYVEGFFHIEGFPPCQWSQYADRGLPAICVNIQRVRQQCKGFLDPVLHVEGLSYRGFSFDFWIHVECFHIKGFPAIQRVLLITVYKIKRVFLK